MKNKLTFIVSVLALVACEKGEIAIEPHTTGDAIENFVSLQPDYRNQIYFDLENNEVVSTNEKIIWDLAFDCNPNGNYIFINTSKSMSVAKSDNGFNKSDTIGLSWTFEVASGNLDSTAFKGWTSNDVYVIDLGYDQYGVHQGFGKIQVTENSTTWGISYCNLSETTTKTLLLNKDDAYNSIFFSFLNGGQQIKVEPPKEDWDLCFTQYTHIFYEIEGDTPYLVSGALLNRNIVEGSKVFDLDFESISYESTLDYPISYKRDVIGYDWKYFDFVTGKYTVDPSQNFIIKSTEGIYFKLHFTDFYNETGDKGYPKFEFQKL